ncbi:MAG: DUF1207 domain-containing protein [Leptospirales bacterium]
MIISIPARLVLMTLAIVIMSVYGRENGFSAPPPDNVTLDQDLTTPSTILPKPQGNTSGKSKGPSSGSSWQLTFLPSQDPFTPLLADPRQPTSAVNFLPVSNQGFLQFNGTFGADVGIARWESTTEGINESIQIGVMGANFSRFSIIQSSTYLEDADYVIGIPISMRFGRFSARFFFYHESSHTGYNYTNIMHLSKASDFGNELIQVVPSWDITPHLRIYAGGAYRVIGLYYYPTTNDSLIFLGGIEAYTPMIQSMSARGYLAFNLESRGINGYTPDEDLQIGMLFHRPNAYFQIRPAIDFYNGYTPMGDLVTFFKENYVSLGVYFDF